jgi:hypothetical protein
MGLAALLVTACGLTIASPAAPPPAPPTIETTGILSDSRAADPIRTFVLEDGRTFEISLDDTRVLFEGGPGQPFVLGRDATGRFVAVFSDQDGRPADCHIVPAGGGRGIDRGLFVEIEGILWRKSADFRSEVDIPPNGEPYVGVGGFCFNERAEVFAAAR